MERSPYTPPTSDSFQDVSPGDVAGRCKGRALATMGVVLFSGPILGIGGTVIRLLDAFEKLGRERGVDAKHLAQDISEAMIFAAIGTVVGLVGVVLVLIAFFGPMNRERWFFRWVIRLAVIWCLVLFPYGLLIGVPMAVLFVVNRAEFRPRIDEQSATQPLAPE